MSRTEARTDLLDIATRIAHQAKRVGEVPVLAPLRGVAVHVMQPPGVGPEAADRGGEGEAIVAL